MTDSAQKPHDIGDAAPPVCPVCAYDHKLPPGKCPSCGREIIPPVGFSFSLATLMMAVTVCAVVSAVATVAIWLSAIFAAWCVMAFFHCRCVISLRQRRVGRVMGPSERIVAFLESLIFASAPFLGAVAAALAIVFVAFVLDSLGFPGFRQNPELAALVLGGGEALAAIFTFIGMTIAIWPATRSRHGPNRTKPRDTSDSNSDLRNKPPT